MPASVLYNSYMPDFDVDPYVERALAGQNVLPLVHHYATWGGNTISIDHARHRRRAILRALSDASVSADRIVSDVHEKLNPKELRYRSCDVVHELPNRPFCPIANPLLPNIGCLHVSDDLLKETCELLQGWNLLPTPAALMQKSNLNRSYQIALDSSPEGSHIDLDKAAREIWKVFHRSPLAVPWWKTRHE